MHGICSFTLLLGRLALCTIFILAGFGKFINYDTTAQYMASKGMTLIPLFLIGAALVEIIGGLSLFLGYKTRIGATLLILFLIPTTAIFHDFWNIEDAATRQLQMSEFLKNLAIFGGLLYTIAVGPGKFSVDGCCCPQCRPKVPPPATAP